jgi:hypothetical protein
VARVALLVGDEEKNVRWRHEVRLGVPLINRLLRNLA